MAGVFAPQKEALLRSTPTDSKLARYIMPNATFVLGPLAVQVLGAAIAVDGAIGVLGLGNRLEHDLGVMLLRGKENFIVHPQLLGLALGMFVLLFSYLVMVGWRLRRDEGLEAKSDAAQRPIEIY